MKFQNIILLSLCYLLASSIKIPIKSNQAKCMLVYSMGEDQTMKLDINLPQVFPWDKQDNYLVTLTNTISNQKQEQRVIYGLFRRQISIHSKVIYQVCFKLQTKRTVNQEIVVDYNADTHHSLSENTIKIPQNLLKTHELEYTYRNAVKLNELAGKYLDLQVARHQGQQQYFTQTSNKENEIYYISLIEMFLILAISAYQFYAIRNNFKETGVNLY